MERKGDARLETLAIHAGGESDPTTGAVSIPIYQSATFAFRNADEGAARFAGTDPGYKYTRLGNPTVRALERCVAELEEGHDALATATGMGAISTLFLALLKSGDHVVGTDAVYGPTRVLLEKQLAKFGIASSWVPTEDIDALRHAMRPETRIVYIETPANPTIKITDIAAASTVARAAGALLVVDNTFCSPILQRPFRFGADVVLHSMTKYLNGHSDVVAGMIVVSTPHLHAEIGGYLRSLGATMDPHQAWLVLRGIRTLALRVERAQANARELAAWLERHAAIAWVSYPGLPSHPQYALASRQMSGPGAMISFGVRGGFEAAKATIDAVRVATLAVSLGGIETLIEHPASMTHLSVPRAEREAAGICDDLVRLSVGCEAVEDLRADLDQALAHATAGVKELAAR
jgi:methionine-gamma-lyase